MAPTFTGKADAPGDEKGCLPDSAVLLWQSFDSPFLLHGCLWAKDRALLGSEAVCAAGPSGGAGRERLPPWPRRSSSEAMEPLSSIGSWRASGPVVHRKMK